MQTNKELNNIEEFEERRVAEFETNMSIFELLNKLGKLVQKTYLEPVLTLISPKEELNI